MPPLLPSTQSIPSPARDQPGFPPPPTATYIPQSTASRATQPPTPATLASSCSRRLPPARRGTSPPSFPCRRAPSPAFARLRDLFQLRRQHTKRSLRRNPMPRINRLVLLFTLFLQPGQNPSDTRHGSPPSKSLIPLDLLLIDMLYCAVLVLSNLHCLARIGAILAHFCGLIPGASNPVKNLTPFV